MAALLWTGPSLWTTCGSVEPDGELRPVKALEDKPKRDAKKERDGETRDDPELIPHWHTDERPEHAPNRGSVWSPPS